MTQNAADLLIVPRAEFEALIDQARYICESPSMPRRDDIDRLRRLGKAFHAAQRSTSIPTSAPPPATAAESVTLRDALETIVEAFEQCGYTHHPDPEGELLVMARAALTAAGRAATPSEPGDAPEDTNAIVEEFARRGTAKMHGPTASHLMAEEIGRLRTQLRHARAMLYHRPLSPEIAALAGHSSQGAPTDDK